MTSSLDLYYLVKEFQYLINGKIDQIYSPNKKEVILQLHIPSKGKQIIRINAPDYIYLISERPEAKAPSDFCMYLRKKLSNSRLRKIEQIDFERIIKFDFETKDGIYSLIAELFSTGNILLVKQDLILTAAEYRKWAGRTIRPKEKYKIPKRETNFLKLTLKQLEELAKSTNKESIVKFLAIDIGLGGTYAEECCLRAKIGKNIKPSEFTETKKLFKALEDIKNQKIKPVLIKSKGIFPFKLELYKSLKTETFETFSSAIEKFIELKGGLTEAEKQYQKKLEKFERVISDQKESIKKLENNIIENSKKAELIYSKYKLIQEIIDELKKAEKKYSWKQIKAKLKNHKIIKDINSKDKTLILEF